MIPPTLGRNQLNFSGGPGALPERVLQEARQAIIALPETGLSVLGMSHRSLWFAALLEEADANLRALLDVPRSHRIAFLQGGASLQFSMMATNFAGHSDQPADYIQSGYWSAKAIEEARCTRPLHVVWSGAAAGYRRLPVLAGLDFNPSAPYLHYVSNETVEGLQFPDVAAPAAPCTIVDMSSDLLSRPIDVGSYGMIYAHAQKNLGPAGVTISILDEALLERVPAGLPPMLDYRTHVRHGSNYNTPPVFAIYVLTLVTRWLRDDIGGLARMEQINRHKAERLQACLQRAGDLLVLHADPSARSRMNICFRFREPIHERQFLAAADSAGFSGLAGHRSLGGIRVSLYNAVSEAAVEALTELIDEFVRTRG